MSNLTKHKKSNNQRLQSLNLKRERELNSKLLISNALKNLDIVTKPKNHITFDSDSDGNDIEIISNLNQKTGKKNVLGLNSDSDNEEIILQPRFEGKFGPKLLEMQSKIGMDKRFKVDERFVESEESEEEIKNINIDHSSELKKNMELLQQVVGPTTVSRGSKKKTRMFNDPSKMRYDPTKKEHEQLEVKTIPFNEVTKKKKRRKKIENLVPEVDKTRFYEVNPNSLKKSFGKKDEESVVNEEDEQTGEEDEPQEFSLLAMMGRNKEDSELEKDQSDTDEDKFHELMENQPEEITTEKKISFKRRVFKHDSSSESSAGEMEIDNLEGSDIENKQTSPNNNMERSQQTFSMTSHMDPRIRDGPLLFCTNKSHDQIREEWLEVKDTLIRDYKKKHRVAVRALKREIRRPKNDDVDYSLG